MADTVWLARHGQRQDTLDPNWAKTAPRPFDSPMADEGHVQARKLGRRLKQEGIGHIFASPFLRTVETAHHVAEALDLPVKVEAGMSEWLQGKWFPERPPMLQMPELKERFPRLDPAYRSIVLPEHPEDSAKLFDRCGRTIEHMIRTYDEPILMIGHGASVVTISAVLLSMNNTDDFTCPLCSLFKLVRTGSKWTLELCADESHLKEV